MCATKAKNYLRQYMFAKPHNWGYKLFVAWVISKNCVTNVTVKYTLGKKINKK